MKIVFLLFNKKVYNFPQLFFKVSFKYTKLVSNVISQHNQYFTSMHVNYDAEFFI